MIDLHIAAGTDSPGWQSFECFISQSDGTFLSVRRQEQVSQIDLKIVVNVPVGLPVPHVARLLRSLANELEFAAASGKSPIEF